jgi:hypothetical protein
LGHPLQVNRRRTALGGRITFSGYQVPTLPLFRLPDIPAESRVQF